MMTQTKNASEATGTLAAELEKLDAKIAAAQNIDLKRELRRTQSLLRETASPETEQPPHE